MAIETICQGCNKRLRVADEHAGKLARCPQCQAVYTVPHSSAIAAALGAGGIASGGNGAAYGGQSLPENDRWQMRSPDGLCWGPVSRAELDRWLAEGRITPQSQILHEGDAGWVWAPQVYPQLQSFTAENPFKADAISPGDPYNPYAPSSAAGFGYTAYPYREQHRGGVVLALSIVAFLFCDIVAIVALVMAITDLQKMRSGAMDPSGRGLTIAGLVIACIKLALTAMVILGIAAGNFF